MAALLIFLCSVGEQVIRISNIFIRSGCSFEDTWNFILDCRQEFLTNKYLERLISEENRIVSNNKVRKKPIKSSYFWDTSVVTENNYDMIDAWEYIDNIEYGMIAYEEVPTMVGNELIQPDLVFSCTLGEVTPGTSYYINGVIIRNCERFAINLTLGPNSKDIALHINPRLPQNYIVRNCKINGHWGKEEVTSALPFSLKRGFAFAIQILVTESEYYISVNGNHFASFRHRIPYNRVTCLQVKGDVTDVQVEEISVLEYPDKLPNTETNLISTIQTWNYDNTEDNAFQGELMKLPYYGRLSEKFRNGKCLHILGRVKILPHSFFINLQQGDKIWPHPNIAFHLNPRFANVGGKHIICRNTWQLGKWDREERSEIYTDFMPSRQFHLTISATNSSYNVYLNGKFLSEYKYRTDANIVDTIYIQGDINLQKIILEISPNEQDLLESIDNFADINMDEFN